MNRYILVMWYMVICNSSRQAVFCRLHKSWWAITTVNIVVSFLQCNFQFYVISTQCDVFQSGRRSFSFAFTHILVYLVLVKFGVKNNRSETVCAHTSWFSFLFLVSSLHVCKENFFSRLVWFNLFTSSNIYCYFSYQSLLMNTIF